MKIHAYAKINLTLDILGRRPDGYHDLVMVMQSVGLYDEVTVKLTDITGIKVTSSSTLLKDDQSNTAYKAAKCFRNNTGTLRIQKRIFPNNDRPLTQTLTSFTARLLKIVSFRPETQYFSNSFRPYSQSLLSLQT